MKNQIRYKKIIKNKVRYKKTNLLEKYNIDTIFLDTFKYWDDVEYNFDILNNVKKIIIDEKLLKNNDDIVIQNTKAENIYIENQSNLGGLTIPIDILKDDIYLQWYKNRKCKLKEINLIFPTKTENIICDDEINMIELFIRKDTKIKNILLLIKGKYKEISYFGDVVNGITNKIFDKYTYTKNDIKDGVLDLGCIDKNSRYINLDADRVIIKKDDLFNKDLNREFDEKIATKELVILDKNQMKLNPEIKVIFDGLIEVYDYFITNGEKTKFIYLNKNNEIKVIDKEKLLESDEIDGVEFITNIDCELLFIKHKNKSCKIIDVNNEYLIDELFGDFLYLNVYSYDFYKKEIPLLKKYIIGKEWDKVFRDKILDNNILCCIYDDYLKFIERIRELKKLGFTDKAIKYLISRKYDNLVNTKAKNILDIKEIGIDEIKLFNFISEKLENENYVVLKKIKK